MKLLKYGNVFLYFALIKFLPNISYAENLDVQCLKNYKQHTFRNHNDQSPNIQTTDLSPKSIDTKITETGEDFSYPADISPVHSGNVSAILPSSMLPKNRAISFRSLSVKNPQTQFEKDLALQLAQKFGIPLLTSSKNNTNNRSLTDQAKLEKEVAEMQAIFEVFDSRSPMYDHNHFQKARESQKALALTLDKQKHPIKYASKDAIEQTVKDLTNLHVTIPAVLAPILAGEAAYTIDPFRYNRSQVTKIAVAAEVVGLATDLALNFTRYLVKNLQETKSDVKKFEEQINANENYQYLLNPKSYYQNRKKYWEIVERLANNPRDICFNFAQFLLEARKRTAMDAILTNIEGKLFIDSTSEPNLLIYEAKAEWTSKAKEALAKLERDMANCHTNPGKNSGIFSNVENLGKGITVGTSIIGAFTLGMKCGPKANMAVLVA